MKRTSKQIRKAFLLSTVLLVLTGFALQPWGVRFNYEPPVMAQIISGLVIEGTVFAVTNGNNLISFNQFTPSALRSGPTAITGLQASELVMGIDFRPLTGVLYAVTNQSRIYTINTTTAAATQVGAAAFTPAVNGTSLVRPILTIFRERRRRRCMELIRTSTFWLRREDRMAIPRQIPGNCSRSGRSASTPPLMSVSTSSTAPGWRWRRSHQRAQRRQISIRSI